jgi:hypothetical protein
VSCDTPTVVSPGGDDSREVLFANQNIDSHPKKIIKNNMADTPYLGADEAVKLRVSGCGNHGLSCPGDRLRRESAGNIYHQVHWDHGALTDAQPPCGPGW